MGRDKSVLEITPINVKEQIYGEERMAWPIRIITN